MRQEPVASFAEQSLEAGLQATRGEQMFRLLVDGIAAQVSTMSATGELEFVNQQVLDYFGRSFEELQDWRHSNAIHPDDLPRVAATLADCLQTGEPYEHEKRLRRFDGVYHWFRAHGRPARDAQGRIIRWYMVLTDIEERKKAEEKLAEQQKELRQILDLAPQMVAVFGPGRERLYANSVCSPTSERPSRSGSGSPLDLSYTLTMPIV